MGQIKKNNPTELQLTTLVKILKKLTGDIAKNKKNWLWNKSLRVFGVIHKISPGKFDHFDPPPPHHAFVMVAQTPSPPPLSRWTIILPDSGLF